MKEQEHKNARLHKARRDKNDEFYTRLEDIENELEYYVEHFKGQTVYLNCDDPSRSKFWEYFSSRFESLGLSRVIATYYRSDGSSSPVQEMTNGNQYHDCSNDCDYPGAPGCLYSVTYIEGGSDGDFRSPYSVRLLEQADIVVTNPPFSLWREYVAQLIEYEKKFIILGNMNAIAYRDVFPLIKSNTIRIGVTNRTSCMVFDFPNGESVKLGFCRWFTNIDSGYVPEPIELSKSYRGNELGYPMYDNYDAIEVSKTMDIPYDYDGIMGVPISFMMKYNPEQFEIVGMSRNFGRPSFWDSSVNMTPTINGIEKYKRILIRHVR